MVATLQKWLANSIKPSLHFCLLSSDTFNIAATLTK